MRALIQRVARASVTIGGSVHGEIDRGLAIFLGVKRGDTKEDAVYLASRIAALRIFNDIEGKMNLSVQDLGGSALVISQFTLHADTRKGNRPSYTLAADPEIAEALYDLFINELEKLLGECRVATGIFRAMMNVELVNEGPVTVMIQSKSEYLQKSA